MPPKKQVKEDASAVETQEEVKQVKPKGRPPKTKGATKATKKTTKKALDSDEDDSFDDEDFDDAAIAAMIDEEESTKPSSR